MNHAQQNVVDGLTRELVDGTGFGIVLRPAEIVALRRRQATSGEHMAAD